MPLTDLLKKNAVWQWDKEEQSAFDLIKSTLSKAPLLAFPDFELPFILTTDASNVGLGAELHQIKDGKLKPIGYASRKLTTAECDYHTTARE